MLLATMTLIQITQLSSRKDRFSLHKANSYFHLAKLKLHSQCLTIQSRLQWSYSPHPPDSPDVSGGWHIQLCDLKLTGFYS